MTGNSYLIDTNVVIDILNNKIKFIDKLNKHDKFYISVIVLGELHTGINRLTNKSKHIKQLNDFLLLVEILPIDNLIAQLYGIIVAELYKKGKPIPTNDIWIASTALQYGLTLLTADNHFAEINQLKTKSF